MKPTKEEYEKALKTIRAYAPERFINVKEHKATNNFHGENTSFVVLYNGYFQLVTATGEIVVANEKLSILDNVNQPLTVIGQFQVKLGEVINEK